ncbi:molybdenum cofactor guanylyltransferase [Pyrobaculum aerophilum]|uniref:Molybdopterin-guanine dinucleotide biosynthesis protein A n=2 Tax=Pyrobaculum aerophilum TaxID=13773 RepID=Q8ZT37_PYRAE|nr:MULTISPECIES: molybdenum cofactor guanylyltransferase [Pyrobaculum]AAL64926.1 molybdopterin-guanine dinucleotide biosynthesis protein A [Pyrobaculum aerophilum str. IM2]MCX8137729.1 molybdenum cofactor guanylyltransferase [Pyrobaculum aerophilum]HII46557.1 molybdenum cofactor guanylyltransferase [Pyrobaculum aerophilum]
MALLVVFAGGRSRRFGREKCTYQIGGRRLIDYVIEAGREVADGVVIAAGNNASLYPGERILQDSARFSGPLAAVDAAVNMFNEELLFAPCDVPNVKPRVFEDLLSARAPVAVWVFPNGRVESTIFKASPEAVKPVLNALALHKRNRLDDLFRTTPTLFLSTAQHGIEPAWLLNVNRPADLEGMAVTLGEEVFLRDILLSWPDPPLFKWLGGGEVDPLREEFFKYVEVGLLSMAAHVAKDLSSIFRGFAVLAEAIYSAVDIEKAR